MSDNEKVLEAIKRFGPVSARGLGFILKIPEKTAPQKVGVRARSGPAAFSTSPE